MPPRAPAVMQLAGIDFRLLTYAVAALVLLLISHSLYITHKLRHIPTVGGPALPVLSLIGAFRYVFDTKKLMQEGYDKYKGGVFKIALFDRWLVVVTGTRLVDELQRAPEDTASFMQGITDVVGMDYIFGRDVMKDGSHVTITRERLTRNMSHMYADIFDEIRNACEQLMPATETGWLAVPGLMTVREIVTRTVTRVFLGRELCRDAGYMKLNTDVAQYAAKTQAVLNLCPSILKPLVGRLVENSEMYVRRAQTFLDPLISDRLKQLELDPESESKPNDMLQWLIEAALARGKPMAWAVRLMYPINFAAIDTTSSTLGHAVYHLAANPEFADVLRAEVQAVIDNEGWSKDALGKMSKVDSFLHESLRRNGIASFVVTRKVMEDFHFSNGTTVPAGTVVVVPWHATHSDEESLPNAGVFNPWRYHEMREENFANTRCSLVSPSNTWLGFGIGRQACPGRFFAAAILKTTLAQLVLNYDLKLEREGVRPPNLEIGMTVVPNISAKILFKKRKVKQ